LQHGVSSRRWASLRDKSSSKRPLHGEMNRAAIVADALHFCRCGILAVIAAIIFEARMIRKLELSVAVVALLGSLCSADTLRLKDGLSHSGTFVSATGHTIAFREGTTVHRDSCLRKPVQAERQGREFGDKKPA
jgi:hypothetical protein